jgi:iron complex transport system substrate-binding protein
VAFLEWTDPLICGGHWNPELVELAGGSDGLGRAGEPSRTVTLDELLAFQPEVLVVAGCGLTAERNQQEMGRLLEVPGVADLPCVRSGRLYALDGVAHFSRPAPSLVESLESLAAILDQTP